MSTKAESAVLAKRDDRIDWTLLRNDFPILNKQVNDHPLVYLDNAASSQKPQQGINAIRRYYEHDNANVHRGIHELSNRVGITSAASPAESIRRPLWRLGWTTDVKGLRTLD